MHALFFCKSLLALGTNYIFPEFINNSESLVRIRLLSISCCYKERIVSHLTIIQ